MNQKGTLAELSRDYGVTPQSVQYYLKQYKLEPPLSTVQSAVCETHKLKVEEKAKVAAAAAAAAEQPSSSKDAAGGAKSTPERRVDAHRAVRKLAAQGLSMRRMQKKVQTDFDLPKFSIGSVHRAATGAPTPERPGGQFMLPKQLQEDVAFIVRAFREWNLPVFRQDVLLFFSVAIEGTGLTMPRDESGFYSRFLANNGLSAKNLRPLDVTREKWYTEENLEKNFANLEARLLKYNYVTKNPDFDPSDPYSQSVFWIPEGMNMVFEFDVSCFKASDADVAAKTAGEKMIGSADLEEDDGTSIVEHSSSDRLSMVGGSFVSGTPLRPGGCFASGDTLDPSWTVDAEGREITIPVLNPATGKLYSCTWDCNKKGSYRADTITRYMGGVLEQMPTKPTAEKPALAYIDGVYTHIHALVVRWCIAHHVEIVLKTPYLSFKLQGQDVVGGQFRIIKPRWRINLQVHLRRKRVRSLTDKDAESVSLGFGDMVSCLRTPWMEAFSMERNQKTWSIIGVRPFTRRPLWELREAKAKKSKRKARAADGIKASENLRSSLGALLGGQSADGGGAAAGSEGARKKKKKGGGRINASHVYNKYGGVATSAEYIAALDAKDTAETSAAEEKAKRKAIAAGKANEAAQSAKSLAEECWVQYELANFKFAGLRARGVLKVASITAVLKHKLQWKPAENETFPTKKSELETTLAAELGKADVIAPFRAALAARAGPTVTV